MEAGERRARGRVARAVGEAEWLTGLEFCVYFGAIGDADPRARAEEMFVKAGLHARPAVLVMVAPDQRRVEVVTAPAARSRISDEAAAAAVGEMTSRLALDQPAAGLVAGIRHLAAAAGPGRAPAGTQELPDILG